MSTTFSLLSDRREYSLKDGCVTQYVKPSLTTEGGFLIGAHVRGDVRTYWVGARTNSLNFPCVVRKVAR